MPKEKFKFLRVKDLPNLELYQGIDATCFVPRHVHWVFSLGVVDAGVRIHETKQAKYCVTAGSVFVVNCNEVHSGSVPEGYSCSSKSIRINPIYLSSLITQITGRQYDTIRFHQPVIRDPELSLGILHLYKVLEESVSTLEKECILLDVLAKLFGHHSREEIKPALLCDKRATISRVCAYLQNCFVENASLDKLAEIADLSPFHLSRIFAKETGVPPHTYQLQVRLKKATDLLAEGKPIVDVALATGFCDQSHFQKAFKKKFGITPGQYRW